MEEKIVPRIEKDMFIEEIVLRVFVDLKLYLRPPYWNMPAWTFQLFRKLQLVHSD
jgi:hypothetical protein